MAAIPTLVLGLGVWCVAHWLTLIWWTVLFGLPENPQISVSEQVKLSLGAD